MGNLFGGESDTTTVNQNYDPVASAKQAEIAERQMKMAEEQWQIYKDYFQGYEVEAAKAKGTILPQYMKEATEGVDVNKRMDQAQTDVTAAMKLGEGIRRREASRMGIDPSSTAFGNSVNTGALETAKGIAGARTAARTQAEGEKFQRLGLALDKPVADPYGRAATTYSGAASTYAPLASRVMSSSKETPSAGFMGFMGNLMGQGTGAFAGSYGKSLGSSMFSTAKATA
jgi:hypothetical protein